MSLDRIGEFGFIDRIGQACLIRPEGVVRAIGDDAAAFSVRPGELVLVTTDLLAEGVHFLRNSISGEDLGHKALAVNLSDIAAMGGTAREAFVSLAIPENCDLAFLDKLYEGMTTLARQFDVNILGGDTTGSLRDIVINITVTGSVAEDEMLRRDRAIPGDCLFLTGCVGDSRAGLHLILNRIPADTADMAALLQAHVRPFPHLEEGRFLARQKGVHAAIDISDGLSSDAGHVARQSKAGVRLQADRIPVSGHLREFCRRFGYDPIKFALSGGEDYVLLAAVAPEQADAVSRAFSEHFRRPLYHIGEITGADTMTLAFPDGHEEIFRASGWNHFREKSARA